MANPSPGAARGRAAALAQRRAALARDLSGRFWLRVHASVIVAGTFAAGFLTNLALLALGLDGVLVRWLIAIAIGYAVFFLLVRMWLAYVGIRAMADADPNDGGLVDLPSGRGGAAEVPYRGGGGQFGGGGASGDFGTARASLLDGTAQAKSGGGLGLDLDLGDAGGLAIVVGVIVVAVVAVLAGSAVHFIWIAPELLADAAFGALLASGALRGLRRVDEPDWDGHVLRATWKPLLGVVVVAVAGALALGHWFPEARTLGDAWRAVR